MDLGIAAWSLHREVLEDGTTSLLDFPAICADKYGVRVIELVSRFFESTSPEYLAEVRQAIDRADARLVAIAVQDGDLAESDEAVRNLHVEALKQWLHVAKSLGAEAIRIDAGRSRRPATPEFIGRVLDGYRELVAEAEHTGVRLLLENHGGASGHPDTLRQYLDGIDSEWFRTCPDFGNFTPGTTYAGLELMLPRAHCVHAKLYTIEPGAPQVLGQGPERHEFDLDRCMQIVNSAGFDGPLCLEWEGPEPAEREAIGPALYLLRTYLD